MIALLIIAVAAVVVVAVVGAYATWIAIDERDSVTGKLEQLRERHARLEEQHADVLVKYFEDSTDPRFERAPEWTVENAQALNSFLTTEHGQALSRRFAAVAAATAIAGCSDAMHTAHSAGNGNGWNEAYEWFVKLSRVTGEQVTKNSEQPDDDEEALLARFSS